MKILKVHYLTKFYFFSFLFFVPALAKAQESDAWSHESELGLILSGGNSDTKTLNAKQKTDYKWTKNTVIFKAAYLYGKSSGVESANGWSLGLRYDRSISTDFTVFLGDSYESDKYAGFDKRNNIDLGGKYYFLNTSKEKYVFSELGYRFTSETATGATSAASKSFLRVYSEASMKLTESATAKVWFEYLPSLSESGDYLFNFEPSIAVTLDGNFALKAAYLGKYDAIPSASGIKKYDYIYSTALVAKF